MSTQHSRTGGMGRKSGLNRQRGISLIEAMVSMLVTSLGMLAFIGLHIGIRNFADVSKQRSEAVRIAQQDMENIRVFRTLPSLTGNALHWDTLFANLSNGAVSTTIANGSTTYTANTSYLISRAVTTSSTAGFKEVQVTVTWKDRADNEHRVVLRNVIGGIDPSTAISLSVEPNGSPVRDTLGRDVQIPIPAKNLGDGTSVFKPTSTATTAFIFNNDTGYVTKSCPVTAAQQTAQLTLADLSGCTTLSTPAYLLSGFIRYAVGNINNSFEASTANDPVPAGTWGVSLSLDNEPPPSGGVGKFEQLTSAYWSSNADSGGYTAPTCNAESLKTISFVANVSYSITNNGTTTPTTSSTFFATVPAGLVLNAANISNYSGVPAADITTWTDEGEKYVGYSCIVYPKDLDANANTPNAWTGRSQITLTGTTATIAAGAANYKVCRFSQDYNLNGYVWSPTTAPASNPSGTVVKIDNEEHPYAYLNTTKSLNNQNFLVIRGDKSCPDDDAVEVNGTGGENYTNATTVTHQP